MMLSSSGHNFIIMHYVIIIKLFIALGELNADRIIFQSTSSIVYLNRSLRDIGILRFLQWKLKISYNLN